MSERTTTGRGGAPAPRTPSTVNAKPSELEQARMRRVLEGPPRPARRAHEPLRSDAVLLSELRACRSDVACLIELVESAVAARQTNMQGDVLTRGQVADLLDVCAESVSKLVREDGLPFKRVGKEYRFLRSEVLAWLSEHDVSNLEGA
jgi:excisionase family DNA binding protein